MEAVLAILEGRELVLLSEGLDLYATDAPASLVGKSLDRKEIRDRSGLALIAVERAGSLQTRPGPDMVVQEHDVLILLGSGSQRRAFYRAYA
jgi:TrkA domain protein